MDPLHCTQGTLECQTPTVFLYFLLFYSFLHCTHGVLMYLCLQCFCICVRSKSGGQTRPINQCSPCQLPIHAHIYNLRKKVTILLVSVLICKKNIKVTQIWVVFFYYRIYDIKSLEIFFELQKLFDLCLSPSLLTTTISNLSEKSFQNFFCVSNQPIFSLLPNNQKCFLKRF